MTHGEIGKEWIELIGTTLIETQMAVYIDFGDKTKWIPKSLMEDWPDDGKTGEVLIKEWAAEEKGLI